MTTVTLVYMTPSLEGLDNVDPAEEFESLDDLVSRAGHDDFEQTLNQAVSYYLYLIESRERNLDFIARPYDSERGVALDDEECGDYHQADIKVLEMEVGTLEDIRQRAGLESVDELLKRSLILFEKIVQAREWGWGIGLYNRDTKAVEWVMDSPPKGGSSPAAARSKGPTLQ